MRYRILMGFLLAILGVCSAQLSAQTLKVDPKKVDPKTEPKVDPKVDPKAEPKFEWPKKIADKDLAHYVKEMREAKDASTRDAAIHILPAFGPDATKAASVNLIHAMSLDTDVNVRLSAISTVPLIFFDTKDVDAGLNALVKIITPANGGSNQMKHAAAMALGGCGPLAKRAIPVLTDFTLKDVASWQNRKAAAFALARIGQLTGKDDGPDLKVVHALSLSLRTETSHMVRREIVNALMLLGPPRVEATWKEMRAALTYVAEKDTDRSVSIWARVALIRSEQDLITDKDPNLQVLVKLLSQSDPALKLEALQALASVGEEAKSRMGDILAFVNNEKEEPFIVATAIWVLSQMKSEANKLIPIIDPMQRHKDPFIKAAAEAAYRALTEKFDPDKKDPMPKKDVPKS